MRLPSLPGPSDVRALLDQLVAAGPRAIRLVHTAEGLLDDVSTLLARIEQTRARADEVIDRVDETRVRTDRALASLEPLPGRATAVLDDVVPLLARADGLVDEAGRIIVRVTPLLDQVDPVVARIEPLVDDTKAVVARAGDLLGRTEPLVERAAPLLHQVEPLVSSLLRPMTDLVPVLERVAETTDPAEVEAVVALMNRLPELVGRLESDVLPMLATLRSVAPDLHDLLDVSRELNEILGKLPGLRGIKKRVEKEQEAEDDEQS